MDPQKESVWKEAVLKENMIRLRWFQRNLKNKTCNQPVQTAGEKQRGVKLPKITQKPEQRAKPSKTPPPTRPLRKKVVEEEEEATAYTVMRPPSRHTRQALYEGLSQEETGRHKYLLLRKDKSPEEKYLYPLTHNWLYGWGLGETITFSIY